MSANASSAPDAVRWIKKAIAGQEPLPIPDDAAEQTRLVHAAQREGLAALLLQQLTDASSPVSVSGPAAPARSFIQRLAVAAHEVAARNMLLEYEARRLTQTIAQSGERVLLLKGVAIAQWAYPSPYVRAYQDVDLVLPGYDSACRIAERLVELGYRRIKTAHPLVGYELLCVRDIGHDSQVELDVHWHAGGTYLTQQAFTFDELWAASVALPALGPAARGLGPVHAFVHACINRTSDIVNGQPDQARLLYDLITISDTFTAEQWSELQSLCTQRKIAGFALAAMNACHESWGHHWPTSTLHHLAQASKVEPFDYGRLADWRYTQWQQLRRQRGLKSKLKWLWHRVIPSHDTLNYQAHSDGDTRRNYSLLLAKHILRGINRIRERYWR